MSDTPPKTFEDVPSQKLLRGDGQAMGTRRLACETPVALEFDGAPYAVMMASPADLEDFAVGFALGERLIAGPADIARIDIREGTKGIAIDVRLEAHASPRLKARLTERARAMPGQSGCGLCGLMTLDEALPSLEPLDGCPRVMREAVFAALSALHDHQTLNAQTGAVHAAAFCLPDGSIAALREDVGRHNACDKLIGHAARQKIDGKTGFLLLTSRCSYELAQKAVMARIPLLVTISAPTTLAATIARDTKLTLVALARNDSMLVFNDPFGCFA
jgi:FdhD protein